MSSTAVQLVPNTVEPYPLVAPVATLDALIDRMAAKTCYEPNTGCWLWLGATTAGGYGKVFFQGALHLTHRITYQLEVGTIPDGYQVDHLCQQRLCRNPAHLEAVTHAANQARGAARRRQCRRGHPFDGDNIVFTSNGYRRCRACWQEASRASWRRRHGH